MNYGTFLAGRADFSLLQCPDLLQIHPASYAMGTMDSLPRGRTATCEAGVEVKNERIYNTPPSYVFMAQIDNGTKW